jgi:pantoate--beta-alanine ligase
MHVIQTIADLRRALSDRPPVTLVPTMGDLHAGHLSLVQIARHRGDPVVTSIFVNPLQFAPHEDFERYPRFLDRDVELLAQHGCDIVFAPTEREMYPDNPPFTVTPPPTLGDILEGAVRPGFFTGVCSAVLRLFNIVRPTAAVFGKKDYQQLLVIRQMLEQFVLPIDLIPGDIVRDSTGLALSSRNAYLSDQHRPQASELSAVLRNIAGIMRAGDGNWRRLERTAMSSLILRGWDTDYVAIRRQRDLGLPMPNEPLLVLGAARIGNTRLIDNCEI